jgi:hypothetical protein
MKRFRRRTALVIAAAAALALSTYAFTASNTVPGTKAGQGEGTVTGYTVSNIQYTLASNPANIDSVAFTLDSAAGTVRAKLLSGSATYTNCSVSGGTNVTCDFAPDVSVLAADELSVIAVE